MLEPLQVSGQLQNVKNISLEGLEKTAVYSSYIGKEDAKLVSLNKYLGLLGIVLLLQ